MNIDRHAREWYAISVVTLPPVPATSWQASFDDEVTWASGTDVTGYDDDGTQVTGVGWLLAGPDYDETLSPNPAGTITLPDVRIIRTKIRLLDNPEVPIRDAPNIYPETS